MKKVQTKRGGLGYAKPKDLLKPFNFCCDINHQDQDTRYNTRIPPLVTSLTNIAPKTAEGPDLKFRLHDVGKPTVTTFRSGTHKAKSPYAIIGHRGKIRGRGPLRWYIEDEIALARDIIANEKVEKRKRAEKHRRDLLQAKKKRRKSKNRKSHEVADDNRGNNEDPKDIDKEG